MFRIKGYFFVTIFPVFRSYKFIHTRFAFHFKSDFRTTMVKITIETDYRPMIILTKYRIYTKSNLCYIISQETPVCPRCMGTLKVRDSKRRKVILSADEEQTFLLRRLKCTSCGALHVELPDLLLPYKHYSRAIIESAASGSATACPAENSTIYRWHKELAKHTD